MAPRKLVFFNHKGGVGKTTLTFHAAAVLAEMGKRVLLVDADPQCNLSSYVIEETALDRMLDNSDSPKGSTLWTAVRDVVNGTGPVAHITPLDLSIPGLSILPGDIRLFEYESALADFWSECSKRRERGFVGVTALSRVVLEVCGTSSIDYVLFDVGPNVGPLNRSIVLDCDALIIPAACDLFSARAFKTLGRALYSWFSEWHAMASLAPNSFPKLRGATEVLGYTVHKFKLYVGVPTTQATKYMANLQSKVSEDLVHVLKDAPGARVHREAARRPIGQVKDFGRLPPISQLRGIPIYQLDEASEAERNSARSEFAALVERMRGRLGDSDAAKP